MSYFSTDQKAKCVLWLAETNDIRTVQKRFQDEFSECLPKMMKISICCPTENEIKKWCENFLRTGSVGEYTDEDRGPDGKINCKKLHSCQKRKSVDLQAADFEKETGLLNFFGFRKVHKCHPFKLRLFGTLENEDLLARKTFAKNELDRINLSCPLWDKPVQQHYRIWFGGEAKFFTNGRVECHNVVYMDEDPNKTEIDSPLSRTNSYVTVFAALNAEFLIGPFITTGNVDLHMYRLYLRKFLYELNQIRRFQMRVYDPIFMHDDCHLHKNSKGFLDAEFPNYWIGPGSTHGDWPKLSPDLNPLAFFLWGHIKNQVYQTPISNNDTEELSRRVHEAFTKIEPEMLEETIKEYKERLQLVLRNNGNLIEAIENDRCVNEVLDNDTIALSEW